MARRSAPTLALALTMLPATASATWSIVAVDPATQEVGVAVATCVEAPFGTQVLPTVPGIAPGIGALAAQAQLDEDMRDYALMLLESGVDAQGVIDMTNAMDFGAQTRQYGVVRLAGDTATFTGEAAMDWAGDVQSTNVTAQGNILYGPEVVDDALAAFEAEPTVCPWTLADRLMVALEAGSAQGGDMRCSMEQSALVAVLQVARATDTKGAFTIDLLIPSQPQGGNNPVMLLRAAYDEWRAMNPPDDSECMPGSESSSSDGGESSSTSGAIADTSGDTSSSSSTGPIATTEPATTTTPSDTSEESSGAPAQDDGERGCSCSTSGSSALALLLPLALRRRRSRRQ
ncbi:MAG TPA: DUF1028 domain-containing protein [Nannocystaceae bacterium]|nr:DUF1028 domain-containing protein [Nannocystaceae bacterium]